MPALTIIINLKGFTKRRYELQVTIGNPKDNPKFREKPLVFTAKSRIHRGRSKVYRGSLTCEGHAFPIDVVCKLTRGPRVADLAEEANLYSTVLTPLHGEYVPLFLYHAQGTTEHTRLPMVATIMTYAGEPVGNNWDGTSDEIRYVAALLALHPLIISPGSTPSWR